MAAMKARKTPQKYCSKQLELSRQAATKVCQKGETTAMVSGQTLLGVPDTFLRTVLSLSPTVNTCVDTISMAHVWLSVVTASDLHMDSARLRAEDIGGPVDAAPAAVEQPTLMRKSNREGRQSN